MSFRFVLTTIVLLAACTRTFAPPARPAITGLCFVKLKTSSTGTADGFYANYLGLQRTAECWSSESNSCFYLTPYQDIEIVPDEEPAATNALETVGVWTEDAKALHEYLVAKGTEPGNLIIKPSGLEYFEVMDPENHRLQFVSKKSPLRIIPESEGQISHHMIHAGLIVRDPTAMNHFYKDILGFHVYWRGGHTDGETDWVDMQVPDGGDWVEYMLNVPANPDQHLRRVMNHIALGVHDVHAAEERLHENRANGTEKPHIGRDGKWQLNLFDPDGTRVELMEFTPVEKPCCSEYTGPHPQP